MVFPLTVCTKFVAVMRQLISSLFEEKLHTAYVLTDLSYVFLFSFLFVTHLLCNSLLPRFQAFSCNLMLFAQHYRLEAQVNFGKSPTGMLC